MVFGTRAKTFLKSTLGKSDDWNTHMAIGFMKEYPLLNKDRQQIRTPYQRILLVPQDVI